MNLREDAPEPTEEMTVNDVSVGQRLGRYELQRELGRGGFGTVYQAVDTQLQRQVAIKVPHAEMLDQSRIEKYRVEAQNLAKLQHQGIVSVFDIGNHDKSIFIVTELLAGSSLHSSLRNETLSWKQAVHLTAQMADALAHAHSKMVVHRDVKPQNVILTPDRGPVLVDFGLSIAGHTDADQIGSVMGTLRYMSPEQLEGQAHRIDGRTDIYALGVLLYRMLTGKSPFRSADRMELRRQILRDDPQPIRQIAPEVPEALQRLCMRAMAKDVAKRFTTAGDFSDRLGSLTNPSDSDVIVDRSIDFSHDGSTGTSIQTAGNSEPERSLADSAEGEFSVSGPFQAAVSGRRHVTVLHVRSSIRGSGADSSDFDPEDQMEALRLIHKKVLANVEKFGGSLLPSAGQDLAICFGYPLSYEDAPRRAVDMAIATQEEIRSMQIDLMNRLDVKANVWLSVHSGMVVVSGSETQELIGDTLTLVTRIDRETDPGDVVLTEATERLVTTDFECEALDIQCHVPGEKSIELHRVLGRKATVASDDDLALIDQTPLVGRDHEVSMLIDRWQLVSEGVPQVVALIGDAGLGKSRLIQIITHHVADQFPNARPPILQWNCSPYHSASAFQPVKDAIARWLEFDQCETVAEKSSRVVEHLGQLDMDRKTAVPVFLDLLSLPESDTYPPENLSSPKQKELSLELIYQWIGSLARQQPLLFIIEDLHWIDPSTLEVLQRIADEPPSDPYLCLETFRPEFTTPWTSRAHQTQIALNRLTKRQVHEIIQSKLGESTVPKGTLDRIVDRTDGVPLFVEEYAKALADSAQASMDTADQRPDSTMGSNSSGPAIPATLQDLLTARLDRIDGNHDVIRLAATLGREFSFKSILSASDLSEAHLSHELNKLVDAQMLFRRGVAPECSYIFKHALIQDAAYDSMLRRQRQKMHRSIADALDQDGSAVSEESPERLAHHRTQAGQSELAVPLWELAGSKATEAGSFVEAVEHLKQGLSLIDRLPESSERNLVELKINTSLGIATLSIMGYAAPELESIYARRGELCRELNDPMGQLHAAWATGSWRIVRDEVQTCISIGKSMIEMADTLKDDGAMMEALFIDAIGRFYHADFETSASSCRAGWQLYEPDRCLFHTTRTGQHSGVAHLCYLSLNCWHLGQASESLETMQKALELAESIDHPFSVAFVYHHFSWLNVAMGRGQAAVDCAEKQIDVSREQAFFFWETTAMLFRAGGYVCLNEYGKADESWQQGMARYQMTGARLAMSQYLGFAARIQIGKSDYEQAQQSLDQAIAAAEEFDETFNLPELLRLRSRLARKRGDFNTAATDVIESLTQASTQQNVGSEIATWGEIRRLLAQANGQVDLQWQGESITNKRVEQKFAGYGSIRQALGESSVLFK